MAFYDPITGQTTQAPPDSWYTGQKTASGNLIYQTPTGQQMAFSQAFLDSKKAIDNPPAATTPSVPAAGAAPAAPPAAPPPTSAPVTADTDPAGDGTVWDATSQMLADAGLSSLLPWYRAKLTEGASSYEIAILIQEQPAFKNRFKAIEERKQAGLPAISPADVLAYEKSARGLLRGAGLPEGFYDHYDDYKDLLVADVSLSELADRIQDGYARVANASGALQSAFFEFYGTQGPDMLAAYFLDPTKAVPVLQQQVEAAGIAGVGSNFGFDLSRGRSEYLAKNEIRAAQARQAFSALAEREGIFAETYAEQAAGRPDLRMEFEGLDAALGLSGDAIKRLEERRQKRVALFSGKFGGAGLGRAGFAFGSASA